MVLVVSRQVFQVASTGLDPAGERLENPAGQAWRDCQVLEGGNQPLCPTSLSLIVARGGAHMWQDHCAHHIQRGDVTAVVWGAPGAAPADESGAGGAGDDGCPESSRSTAAAPAQAVDAESLTRGRRSENPFVQQCDLIFPLPDQDSVDGDAGALQEVRSNACRPGVDCSVMLLVLSVCCMWGGLCIALSTESRDELRTGT